MRHEIAGQSATPRDSISEIDAMRDTVSRLRDTLDTIRDRLCAGVPDAPTLARLDAAETVHDDARRRVLTRMSEHVLASHPDHAEDRRRQIAAATNTAAG